MYMLDTDICIYTIKNKPAGVSARLSAAARGSVCMSAITYAELVNGALKSRSIDDNLLRLQRLAEVLDIFHFDRDAAEAYGRVRSDLERRGQVIGSLDMLIAGHAMACDCILVTNNEGEFCRVAGLKVENWAR